MVNIIDSTINMSGKHINEQGELFVVKLLEFFRKEKENGGPFIALNAVELVNRKIFGQV